MAKRISKSAIDWAKFASIIPKSEMANFNAFKARSDGYLLRALSYPENPPQIDFNQYKSKVANKDLVQKLEQAYKSMKIVYPTDTERGAEIAKQEAEHKKQCESYIPVANGKIAEAQALKKKFELMIPFKDMNCEDFALTFPDWVSSNDNPSIFPSFEKTPGLSKEVRDELAKPDGKPFSTI